MVGAHLVGYVKTFLDCIPKVDAFCPKNHPFPRNNLLKLYYILYYASFFFSGGKFFFVGEEVTRLLRHSRLPSLFEQNSVSQLVFDFELSSDSGHLRI